jgi:adenine-specific DNA-methyltransferase
MYLPELVKASNSEILKHLTKLPELKVGNTESAIKAIDKINKELSDPKHPVSKAIENMDGIEEIRIIEGRK